MIDPTITMGNVIEIGVFAFSGLLVLVRQSSSVGFMKEQLKNMQIEIKELAKIVTQVAVASTRLDNIEEDVRLLRQGKGFIRQEINKEWTS